MTLTNDARTVKIRYFAWVREKTGQSEETLTLPEHIVTISDLINWLTSRNDRFAEAFAKPGSIRAAIDFKHVPSNAEIGAAREIGFFPPVTGG